MQKCYYFSQAIIYGVFTFFNFFAAPIVNKFGPKIGLVLGASTYLIFQSGFFFINEPFLYISSALLGAGAAGQ